VGLGSGLGRVVTILAWQAFSEWKQIYLVALTNAGGVWLENTIIFLISISVY
jgi:hypothetical protein